MNFIQGFCSNPWFMGSLGLRTSDEPDALLPSTRMVGLAGLGGSR